MTTRYSYLSVANSLFLQGADITICDTEAVNEAAVEGDLDMMRYLTLQGVNTHTYEALVYAAMYGRLEVVKFLVRTSGDTFKTRDRNHALAMAAKGNHLAVVRFLQDKSDQSLGVPFILAMDVDSPRILPSSVAEYLLDSYGDRNPPIFSEKILTCIEEYRRSKKRVRDILLSSWKGSTATLVAKYL